MKVFDNGKEIKTTYVGDFREGLAVVRRADGMYNHIRQDGSVAFDTWWKGACDFSEGFALVRRDDGMWNRINTNGDVVKG